MPSNFLDRYVEVASKSTDAPIEFHRFIGYAVAGIALARNIHFPFGANNIYPNFYMTIIAPSSTYRKSTVLAIGQKVLGRWRKHSILPAEFSQEKLLDILEQQPEGAFFYYEFKTLLGLLRRDYMQGVKAFLTEMYDCPPFYDRATKARNVHIENPCMSIISATTMEWFLEMVKKGDLTGGFLTRFLFIPTTTRGKPMSIPPRLEDSDINKLVVHLEDIVRVRGEMSLSEEAHAIYDRWYHSKMGSLENEENKAYVSSMSRMAVNVIKFAMINAIIYNKTTIIQKEHLQSAIQTVNWLAKQMEIIIKEEVEDTYIGKLMKRVLKYLKEHNGEANSRDILRNMSIQSRPLTDVLENLQARGDIDIEYIKNHSGPPSKLVKRVVNPS